MVSNSEINGNIYDDMFTSESSNDIVLSDSILEYVEKDLCSGNDESSVVCTEKVVTLTHDENSKCKYIHIFIYCIVSSLFPNLVLDLFHIH